MRINGGLRCFWRAVDHEGQMRESFVTKRRDRKAALRFMRKAMKRYGGPNVVVTDQLRSYRAAMKVIGNTERQETGRWLNNRAENSHQPFRRRERAMVKFRSAKSQQKFFNLNRSPLSDGVKLPLETTGDPDLLPRPHSSDSALRPVPEYSESFERLLILPLSRTRPKSHRPFRDARSRLRPAPEGHRILRGCGCEAAVRVKDSPSRLH